ncbi:MAG TPA: hypothetical protein VE643_01740 [Nitrososphaeraceae archaeon]|nr:hypothetical protein [Nitrososphaeraceae archaeon]
MKSHITRKKYTGRLIRVLEFTGLVQGTARKRCKAFVDSARKKQQIGFE